MCFGHRYWCPFPAGGISRPMAGLHRYAHLACRYQNPHFKAWPQRVSKDCTKGTRLRGVTGAFTREQLGSISVACPFRPVAKGPEHSLHPDSWYGLTAQSNRADKFGSYSDLCAKRARQWTNPFYSGLDKCQVSSPLHSSLCLCYPIQRAVVRSNRIRWCTWIRCYILGYHDTGTTGAGYIKKDRGHWHW